jgi:hypothetical protein
MLSTFRIYLIDMVHTLPLKYTCNGSDRDCSMANTVHMIIGIGSCIDGRKPQGVTMETAMACVKYICY